MRKTLTISKVFLLSFVLSATISGCQKDTLTVQNNSKLKPKTSANSQLEELPSDNITVLKTYMAGLLNADVDSITYDEETQQFLMFGVNQISLSDLQEFYTENNGNVE